MIYTILFVYCFFCICTLFHLLLFIFAKWSNYNIHVNSLKNDFCRLSFFTSGLVKQFSFFTSELIKWIISMHECHVNSLKTMFDFLLNFTLYIWISWTNIYIHARTLHIALFSILYIWIIINKYLCPCNTVAHWLFFIL